MNGQPSVLQASQADNPAGAGTGCLMAILDLVVDVVTGITIGAAGLIATMMAFYR